VRLRIAEFNDNRHINFFPRSSTRAQKRSWSLFWVRVVRVLCTALTSIVDDARYTPETVTVSFISRYKPATVGQPARRQRCYRLLKDKRPTGARHDSRIIPLPITVLDVAYRKSPALSCRHRFNPRSSPAHDHGEMFAMRLRVEQSINQIKSNHLL